MCCGEESEAPVVSRCVLWAAGQVLSMCQADVFPFYIFVRSRWHSVPAERDYMIGNTDEPKMMLMSSWAGIDS